MRKMRESEVVVMGGKYHLRTDEVREFADTTDYYIDSLFDLVKLLISKRNRIIFVTKNYY